MTHPPASLYVLCSLARSAAEALAAIARAPEREATHHGGAHPLLALASHKALSDAEASSCIHALLLRGSLVDAIGPEGETALLRSLALGRYALAIDLLDLGANPSKPNRAGQNPMHVLSLRGYGAPYRAQPSASSPLSENPEALDCAAMLLAAGGSPCRPDLHGRHALFEAAAQDRPELCRLLLSADADCQTRDANGVTPLAEALRFSSLSAAKAIVDRLNLMGSIEPISEPAIHAAADSGRIDWAETLVELGAYLPAIDSQGMDASARAASLLCPPGVASFLAAARDEAILREGPYRPSPSRKSLRV